MSKTPFEIVSIICEKKEHEKQEIVEDYNPFIINRALSNVMDTCFFSNEMNKYSSLSKDQQFDFYINIISRGKRYGQWHKLAINKNVEIISGFYQVSKKVAEQYAKILSDEQINSIKKLMMKGGSG